MVIGARVCAGHGSFGIVQQGGCVYDLQVSPFSPGQEFCHVQDAQYVVKIMHRIGGCIP